MQGTFNEILKSDLEYAQMLTAEPVLNEEEQQLEREKTTEAVRLLARVSQIQICEDVCEKQFLKREQKMNRERATNVFHCGFLMAFSKRRCRRIVPAQVVKMKIQN